MLWLYVWGQHHATSTFRIHMLWIGYFTYGDGFCCLNSLLGIEFMLSHSQEDDTQSKAGHGMEASVAMLVAFQMCKDSRTAHLAW